MYFYFCSDYPSAIKLSGVYYASVYKSVAFLDLYPPYPLIEILPLSANKNGYAFFPDEKFLSSPPKNITVTDLNGGYFLNFSFPETDGKFSVVRQQKWSDVAATLFFDNGYKLSLETAGGFLAENYGFKINDAKFTERNFYGVKVIFAEYYAENTTVLNVYLISSNPELIFSKEVQDFTVTPSGFTVTENKCDMAKHVIISTWEISEKGVIEKERTVKKSETFSVSDLNEKLIPYAFTEELLCGGDVSEFIGGTVKENAENLKPFFGDFIGIIPPPVFREPNEVGLIYKLKERVFRVGYFTFDVENRKITGIVKK